MNFLQGFGSGVGGLLDGYRTGVSDDQARQKLEAELAYKKQESERMQALLAIQQAQEGRAAQAQASQMEEIARRKAAEQELVQRLAPQKLVEQGIPTELGQGLLGKIPEYQDAMVGPYADVNKAIQRQENPAWRQWLETLQQQKEMPANPLTTQEIIKYGVGIGDKNILEKAIPKPSEIREKLLTSGKYDPQSIDDFLSGKGQLKFAKDPSVITWSDPFEANIGGKRALVQKSSTGQIKPVIEDKSTTIINNGGGTDKATMYEQRAAYGELPKLRQEAQAASVVLPRLDRMKQILESGNAGDTVAYLRQYLSPYAPEAKGANEAQLFQILARTIAGPQRINIIGPGAQTEREGDILRQVGGGGNQGRAALRELLNVHSTANKATIESYNSMIDAAKTKIYKPIPMEQVPSGIPQAAVDKLKSDPRLAVYFDQKYGKGAAQRVLGGR